MRKWILFILLLLILSPSLRADENAPAANVSVKSELNKALITIGDPVQYSVTVKHDNTVKVLTSIPAPDKNIFKVKKIEDIREEEGTTLIEGKRFTLTTFKLGEFILDPVKIEYRAPGGEVENIETNRLFIKVKSVSGDEEQKDIRGIKSVLSIPKSVLLPAAAGGGVFLLLILLLLFKWLRRRPAIEAPREKILSAEEEAFLHLNQLFDSDLLAQGLIKEYYLQFSEIIRIYLERRYRIQAVESTTFEIAKAIKDVACEGSLRSLIKEVLEFADLAKFAKFRPDVQEITQMNAKGREIIELAKPREASGSDAI